MAKTNKIVNKKIVTAFTLSSDEIQKLKLLSDTMDVSASSLIGKMIQQYKGDKLDTKLNELEKEIVKTNKLLVKVLRVIYPE